VQQEVPLHQLCEARLLSVLNFLVLCRFTHIGVTAAICPEGTLVTGKGSRFILSGKEELLDRIDTLTERVRALEQGLDNAWREGHPNDEHPLLSKDFRLIATNGQRSSNRFEEEDLVEAMEAPPNLASAVKGTLSIMGETYNSTKYYGVTARTEVCLLCSPDFA
jgi:hypothetical protein